jgi:hypothetical protein
MEKNAPVTRYRSRKQRSPLGNWHDVDAASARNDYISSCDAKHAI